MISVVLPIITPTPFLRAMTEFSIATLKAHATAPFELIVVEANGLNFQPAPERPVVLQRTLLQIDKYLPFNPGIGAIREFNAALKLATGDYIVSTGNDVIVPEGWDAELLRIFAEQPDCGIASLAAVEPGAIVGPSSPRELVSQQAEIGPVTEVEGMYSPFMMWRRGWEMCEDYQKIYCDSDLVMRVYATGQRAYRSCTHHVRHFARMTSDRVDPEKHADDLAHDERLFYQRWGRKRWLMFALLRAGRVTYGQEHLSFTCPINLHYTIGATP